MIAACSTPAGPPSLARDVLASTDCFIADRVEQTYAQLLAPGGSFATALTAALTIYVALYGYRLILGQASLSMGDLVPQFVKIGIVLALVTSWPSYQRLAFRLLFNGPQEIAGAIISRSGDGGPEEVILKLQDLFDDMTEFAGEAWPQHTQSSVEPTSSAETAPDPAALSAGADRNGANLPLGSQPTYGANRELGPPAVPSGVPFSLGSPQFVAISLWASALLMLAASVGLLLIVKIILAVLLAFGPVFIALALFPATRGLFEGWLRPTTKFALVPMIVLPLTAVMVVVLGPFVDSLEPGPIESFRDTPALAVLVIIVVFAVVLGQALSLTGMIAGAIRLPRANTRTTLTDQQPRSMSTTSPPKAADRVAEIVSQITPPIATQADGGNSRTLGLSETAASNPGLLNVGETADISHRLGQSYRSTAGRNAFVSNLSAPAP